jgi:flagellar motor switch/type III secretory pathway protein FliN
MAALPLPDLALTQPPLPPPPRPPAPPPTAPPVSPADAAWEQLQWLPCNLAVELTVPRVTVGDVLRLGPHTVVETRWQQNADVPIRANGQLIAWAEFEGVDEKLAVRVTRLA